MWTGWFTWYLHLNNQAPSEQECHISGCFFLTYLLGKNVFVIISFVCSWTYSSMLLENKPMCVCVRSSLFWDVTQGRLVVGTDVSEEPIDSNFKGQAVKGESFMKLFLGVSNVSVTGVQWVLNFMTCISITKFWTLLHSTFICFHYSRSKYQ